MRSKVLPALILFSLGVAFAAPLRADNRVIPPEVTKVWPVGMQRGTTATFTLDGRNLSDIKAVIFDAPGITTKVMQVTDVPEVSVKIGESAPVPQGRKQTATIEVSAAKDVEQGLHWFRIQTPLGTSNLMPFDVGSFPEVHSNEKARGHAVMHPEPAALPATFVGTIAVPGQVDGYEFEGRAGEELVFQVTAAPLGSKLESQVVMRNDSGQVLAQSGEYLNRPDAVLTYKLPQAGKYTLSVTDREKGGSPDHFYRVNAGPLPYITQVFPLGVRAGEPASVSVTGVNLGELHEVKVDPHKSAYGWTTIPFRVKGEGA
jgi:hypothetical protein